MEVDLNKILVDCPALDAQYTWERVKNDAQKVMDLEIQGLLYNDLLTLQQLEQYKKVYRNRVLKAERLMQKNFN